MDRKLNSNMKAIPFTNTKANERKGGTINQGEIKHKNQNKIKPWKEKDETTYNLRNKDCKNNKVNRVAQPNSNINYL